MTREELVEKVELAKTARDVALAEISETHRVLIETEEEALAQFDANADIEETVEEAVAEVEVEGEVEAEEVVSEEVAEAPVEPEVVAEDDDTSPTAEEEEVLRKAAEIEAKYKVDSEE